MHVKPMQLLFVLFIVLNLAACAEPPYTNLNNEELAALQKTGVPVFDIRRADEWRKTGVIAGSRKLTFVSSAGRLNPEFLPRLTDAVGKDEPLILICQTGSRSDALGRLLVEKLGFTKVYNVRHGISDWIRDRRPVVR